MSEHGAMTWTGFILLNLRSREQYSEAFGSRNGGMMSQTIINISRYTLLHRVKRYRWLKKKDTLLKCQYSVLYLPVTNFSALRGLHTEIQTVKQIWKTYSLLYFCIILSENCSLSLSTIPFIPVH